MRIRPLGALLVSAVLALALAGCGAEGGGGADPTSLSGEVTMWIPPIAAEKEKAYWDARIAAFSEKYPKIKVKVEITPWENRGEKLTTAIAGRTAPDVSYMLPADVANYGSKNVLTDLTDVIADDRDDFRPNALKATTVDGKLYGVPALMSVTTTVYNKKVLQATGITAPPKTWDEVRAVADKVKAAGYYVTQYEAAPTMTLNGSFYPLLWQAGGDLLTEDGKKAAFNGPEGLKALEFAKWLVDNGHTPADAITTAMPTETSPLAQGKVLMVFSRSVASLKQNGLTESDLVVAAPLKDVKQASYGTVGSFSLFKTSKNPAAAKAWIDWITSADEVKQFLPPRSSHSARISVTGLYEPGSLLAQDGAQLEFMTVGLNTPQASKIMDILKPHLQSALLGKVTPRAALDAAAKEVDTLL